jgi:hypothetical protein
MIHISQTLQTPENCRYRTVTAALCPASDQGVKSTLNQALEITEIRDHPPETDVLMVGTKVTTIILTYLQPSASLQSP